MPNSTLILVAVIGAFLLYFHIKGAYNLFKHINDMGDVDKDWIEEYGSFIVVLEIIALTGYTLWLFLKTTIIWIDSLPQIVK